MGFNLTPEQFDHYLGKLSDNYRLFAPTLMTGKGKFSDTHVVGYSEITRLSEIITDQKSIYSPKEIFYPIRETLFYFNGNDIIEPKIDEKPILIFLRPCDLNGVKRLDTIFLKNGDAVDYYYLRRRNLIKFALIECTSGFDTCFCVSMGTHKASDYDMAVRFGTDALSVDIHDEPLNALMVADAIASDFTPEIIKANLVSVTVPEPHTITEDIFNHPLWTEYTQRCISCGRCNTSCITCSCFSMQDTQLSDDQKIGERRRVWAGCHVDGFTDMAGGHSFRVKKGDRMRFKAMHKINDFHKRFGYHMCVGCGRCDDVCPEYISFSKCIQKINQVIAEGDQHE